MGIGCGRILRVGDHDVWGREVNAASRLGEDTARSGEILLTSAARAALGRQFPVEALQSSPFDDEPSYRLFWLPEGGSPTPR